MKRLIAPESMAGLFGMAFVVVGVAGFVPGLVDHYEQLGWWRGSDAQLLGVFQVSILLNLVHVGFGTLGLLMARTTPTARVYLSGGGAAYLALGVYGLFIDRAGDWNVVPVNRADDWVHLGLGVAMLYAGLAAALPGLRPAPSS
jgi:nitrate reductase gamma subunit